MNVIDPELHALILELSATAQTRVFPITHGGRKFWVKRAGTPRLRASVLMQRILAALFALPILKPPRQPSGAAALAAEAAAIRRLAQAGLPVPEVIACTDQWLVLGDAGRALEADLHSLHDPVERWHRIDSAGALLTRLHRAGLWHGGAQIRNFSWQDAGPGLLDLEDHDLSGMSLAERQARDLLLFLYSLARYDRESDAPRLRGQATIMLRGAGRETCAALAKFLRRVDWLLAGARLIAPRAGRDVQQVAIASIAIKGALAQRPD